MFKSENAVRGKKERIIASESFGPSKRRINSFVYMMGSDINGIDEFWFAETKLLFRLRNKALDKNPEFAFVKFLVTTPPRDKVEQQLGCVMLRWETEDNIDHSIINVEQYQNNTIRAGENYGLVSLKSICGTMQLIRSNYGVHPFTKELPWTHHRFYVNRFIDIK